MGIFDRAEELLSTDPPDHGKMDPAWDYVGAQPKNSDKLRRRATCVVLKEGKVLLVRDKGKRSYSLPGGGIKHGEPSISAAARELYEETGLRADKIERVMTHVGATQRHSVFLITAHHGEPRLKSEIDSLLWWNQGSSARVQDHVRTIIGKLEIETREQS